VGAVFVVGGGVLGAMKAGAGAAEKEAGAETGELGAAGAGVGAAELGAAEEAAGVGVVF
jgi:hypothetical protein